MVSAPTRFCLLVVAATLARSELAVAQSDDARSDQSAVPSGISGAVVRPAAPAKEAPKKPVIVLPELTHFEHADYPAEAEKSGLQADVVLKLTVDRDWFQSQIAEMTMQSMAGANAPPESGNSSTTADSNP